MTFLEHWLAQYPACPPQGHLLRQRFPARWFRIHSLPESKRYAQGKSEMDEILRRQNAILGALLGVGRPYVLVTQRFSDDAVADTADGERPLLMPAEDLDEGVFVHFSASDRVWQTGSMDPQLVDIANDAARALFAGVEQRCVVAPYDGGVDIIVETTELRDSLKARWASWASSHPAGL